MYRENLYQKKKDSTIENKKYITYKEILKFQSRLALLF